MVYSYADADSTDGGGYSDPDNYDHDTYAHYDHDPAADYNDDADAHNYNYAHAYDYGTDAYDYNDAAADYDQLLRRQLLRSDNG